MSDENTSTEENQETQNQQTDANESVTTEDNQTEEMSIEERIAKAVEEQLKPMKDNLNKAYKARDDAIAKSAEYEQKATEAQAERLRAEGKEKEAFELQLAQEKARAEALEKRNTELTRDAVVKDLLRSYEFRSNNALNMAYKEITSDLVQGDNGQWQHKSGDSMAEYVHKFVSSEENSFLLKPKINSGGGTNTQVSTNTDTSNSNKSLFEMSQQDVLQMAAEGRFRK
jgi:hypothetical protein